jgi:aspartate aminotransferase-like enzyme
LDCILTVIEQEGLENLFHQIHRRAKFTQVLGQRLGFTLYAKAPSDSVTALTVPPQMDGQKIRLHLEQVHNITVMGGQDQAKGKIIRIGHMGYIQDQEMIRLIECLGHTLRHFDPDFVPPILHPL